MRKAGMTRTELVAMNGHDPDCDGFCCMPEKSSRDTMLERAVRIIVGYLLLSTAANIIGSALLIYILWG